jgi:hypothetical protein
MVLFGNILFSKLIISMVVRLLILGKIFIILQWVVNADV